ncbi:MAG: agmatine/peptidylarginine deiminase [Pirellula sp.]|jgi:agmatine deiminase
MSDKFHGSAEGSESACKANDDGYRWVAEWERHEATWISWPHNESTWPGRFAAISPVTEKMIRAIAEVEHVHVLGGPADSYAKASQALRGVPNVTVHDIQTNDCWIRDYGPTFLIGRDPKQHEKKKLGAVRWTFNAWGGKYHPHDKDAAASRHICDGLDEHGLWHDHPERPMKSFRSSMVCEGGGLETDGEGTLLTTSSCLMASTRNFRWTRTQVEDELKSMLGVTKVLWVDGGELAGDDTDSHIDQLVRFIRPGLVVAAVSFTTDDSNSKPLEKQKKALEQMTDAHDRPFQIVPLVTPPPRMIQGKRVPESYCNFYLANGIVIVPTFGYRETDDRAAGQLQELFPDRDIVRIDASDFIWGLGAFHCATQQQPAV